MFLLLRIESVGVPNNEENRQLIQKSIEKFLDWRFTRLDKNACPIIPRESGTEWSFTVEQVTSELPPV